MIVAIHQPNFLPWLGYFDRMQRADLFILLDHVQFERRNYQNRTRILLDGSAQWLTVPVQQHAQTERINDKRIDNPANAEPRWWAYRHWKTLRHAYRAAPYLNDYAPTLRRILESRHERLVDLNLDLLKLVRDALNIRTPMVPSSELSAGGARSQLILNLCQAAGANTYLAGTGGSRDYIDREAFERAGIAIQWQKFNHPQYPQCASDGQACGRSCITGLSAIDLLLNAGPHSRTLLHDAATAHEAALA